MGAFRRLTLASITVAALLPACQPRSSEPVAQTKPPKPHRDDVKPERGAYPTMKREIEMVDPVSGSRHLVLDGVELRGAKTATLPMMLTTVVGHTFIPARIANEIGAEDLGEIELSATEPGGDSSLDEPAHLAVVYGVNRTEQRRFRKIRIERVALGVGPAFGPVEALVLNDANASIGVVGREWLCLREGDSGFILAATGEVYFARLKVARE